MSKQHYIPASYIGRFSADADRAWRKRRVWVQRIGCEPYAASAEYVGNARRLYDREQPVAGQRATVDGNWKYEWRLPDALNALTDQAVPLDGRVWAQVLVQFVSALFIRGIDFNARYEKRIPGITGPSPEASSEPPWGGSWHDNALQAGQNEWQRLLAPTMVARWIVLRGSGDPILPTNDVAHCITINPDTPEEVAYAIPIDPSTLLVVERQVVRRILDWNGHKWVAPIEHRPVSDDELVNFRTAIQHGAFREVYGPTRESVVFPDVGFEPKLGPLGPGLLHFSRRQEALPYLEDYFRVLTILEADCDHVGDGAIDIPTIAKSWGGDFQCIANAPRFPGGLAFCAASVYLDFTRFSADDFENHLGKQTIDDVPTEPSPALRELLSREGIPFEF